MFASTSYCTVANRPARFSHEALPSGFKGEKSLSSAGLKGDSLALKANVCPKPSPARTKSSTLEVSAILADRPIETLVRTPRLPLHRLLAPDPSPAHTIAKN
jgi:hypothetical protein